MGDKEVEEPLKVFHPDSPPNTMAMLFYIVIYLIRVIYMGAGSIGETDGHHLAHA